MKKKARPYPSLALLLALCLLIANWTPMRAFDPGQPPKPTQTLIGLDKGKPNFVREPSAPSASGGPDQFGYTWDDSLAIDWKDATQGTAIIAPGTYVDDEVYGPIPLPAAVSPFKYYENQFTQVYVGSNGLLGFDESIDSQGASLENLPIPLDYEYPQDFLAPFWDDLVIGGEYNNGAVYWDEGVDQGQSYFVVEWYQVSRVFANELLTFEIILYADGSILFQYLDLNGNLNSATVGIENSDGNDGLQYLYNGSGLPVASGMAILFTPPGPGYRVKAFPLTQGGFNTNDWSIFHVYVSNTGDQGEDTYNLNASSSDPAWQVGLFDATGLTPLADSTSGDGLPDTGPLTPGETFTVTVKIEKPTAAGIGMETTVTMDVLSDNDPGQSVDVNMTTLVPAPFALIFREGQQVFTELFSENNYYLALEHNEYRGSSFVLNSSSQARFIGLWEHNELGTSYTNLYYTIITSAGVVLYEEPRQLTDNQDPGMDVRDFAPVVVAAPNGNIAIAWIHAMMGLDPDDPLTFLRVNRNVYFTILSPDGTQTVLPVTNLTHDTGWYYSWDLDITQYESVNITASNDNYFHLSWVEKHILEYQTTTDLAYAVYRANDGFNIRPPGLFTSGNPNDNLEYFEPALTAYQNAYGQERVLLFYIQQDSTIPGDPISRLVYTVLRTDGTTEIGQTMLNTGSGYGIDAAQLSDGRIAVAWTDTSTESNRVAVIVLRQNLANPPPATYLYNPDGRPGGMVSVARDDDGHAILTWMDSKWSQRLYYALVDAGGALNLPLAFKYSSLGGISGIQTSDGLGNAAYSPWFRYLLPLVVKP